MVRLAFRSAYRFGFYRKRAKVWALGALALVPPGAVSALAAEPTLVVRADVVALDHLLVYNRFGSFNPFGQIFALRRDVSARADGDVRPDSDRCSERTGAEAGVGDLTPGNVRLKDCKRARPLTLRAPAGSIVEITLTNLLRRDQPDISGAYADPPATPGQGFCREEEARSDGRVEAPVRPDIWASFQRQCKADEDAKRVEREETGVAGGPGADWPRTRGLSLVIPGLEPLPIGPGGAIDPACTGLGAIAPGATVTCRWRTVREGTHLFSSYAAPSGGEGDAGSLGHGLFGALIVEPTGARAFRSQVTARAFDCVWARKGEAGAGSGDCPAFTNATLPDAARHARMGDLAYDRLVSDGEAGSRRFKPRNTELFDCGSTLIPLLSITRSCSNASAGERVEEIVHGDLNAIVVPPVGPAPGDHKSAAARLAAEASAPFREFTAIFHDELKTFYADRFKELGEFGQLAGIRDGFGINYGASGAGSAVLANRQRIGPAADCAECLYEEFFLESWANGDPALLEAFADDPSNVHHSYLNDKVVIRNFHAGKETHVFHLHSHQWFAGNDAGRGAYLDSQTIGPQQGFTYRIYHGGLDRFAPGDGAPKGWWQSLGSGNRNRTPGDAIFHCHLYPHFAQGMWALWRVHDVLEDGSRVLPDGQKEAKLSATPEADADIAANRSGSVGPAGEWLGERGRGLGTPVPAVIPLPAQGLPLLPTYRAAGVKGAGDTDAMPGYPFYIGGKPGRRSPQPPLDMARAEAYPEAGLTPELINSLRPSPAETPRAHLDGGLPRHVVAEGRAIPSVATEEEKSRAKAGEKVDIPLARMLALGDMTSEFLSLKLELLPQTGTRLEKNAMSFHGDGAKVALRDALGRTVSGQNTHGAYESPMLPRPASAPTAPAPAPAPAPASAVPPVAAPTAMPAAGHFAVNGSPSAPGAPFADPCAAPLSLADKAYRRFNAVTDAWEPTEVSFAREQDPFRPAGAEIVADPALIGFRRFDVSAAQLSLVVNRAGWHDPQARINMLSTAAGGLLPSGERVGLKGDRRADAEPLFFRAFSGECIEFHHTNETPKHLELDDFQMKVPTDTIGQHIHLVKFDVTSSDGSGNGFNYEDGTFAPDEILERICKSKGEGGQTPRLDETVAETVAFRSAEECHRSFIKKVPSLARLTPENLKYFQTTIQRWFADPILANDGENTTSSRLTDVADRTMRTVFTHDHFGPSNIQQHGFYSALLIEPSTHATCRTREAGEQPDGSTRCVVGPAGRDPATTPRLARDAQKDLIGARADVFRLKSREPADPKLSATPYAFDQLHPDSREYAIAVADFALLYDGKSRSTGSAAEEPKGVDRLVDEANNPERAGSSEDEEGEIAPARALLERRRQRIDALQLASLSNHRDRIRLEAGRPIAPPRRPEAISADHHDPYLVNYRDEPVPLRVGGTSDGGSPSFVTNPCRTKPASDRHAAHESIVRQRSGPAGGLENLFLSRVHGDPCTPILEGLSGDRILVRLIQGAQEVQHNFMIEGRPGRRNVDQTFPAERPIGADSLQGQVSRAAKCASNDFALLGLPHQFPAWAFEEQNAAHWKDFEALLTGCDNPLGLVSSQEIGISEHFEVGSLYLSGSAAYGPFFKQYAAGKTGASSPFFKHFSGAPQSNLNLGFADAVDRPVLDLTYHFGSVDSLWNGAWGLARTYADGSSPDVSACLRAVSTDQAFEDCVEGRASAPIGERLRSFDDLRARAEAEVGNKPAPPAKSLRTARVSISPDVSNLQDHCPDPAKAPKVRVLAAALRVDQLFDVSGAVAPGATYQPASDRNRALFDPDGLALVPLDWSVLGLKEDDFKARDADVAAKLDIEKVRSLAKAAYSGRTTLSPFVLRIRAGDCLELMVVNALPASGIPWDAPGDALMPKITPLNVDSSQGGTGGHQLSPSRHVALSIPLPVAMPKPGGLQAAGANDVTAIPPASGSAVFVRTTRYYAGFLWPRPDDVLASLRGDAFRAALQPKLGDLTKSVVSFTSLGDKACGLEQQVAALGVVLCYGESDVDPREAADRAARIRPSLQAAVDDWFAGSAKGAAMRAIPYAFGALPIRATGDPISHGTSGLGGTLVVEPAAPVENGISKSDSPGFRHDQSTVVTVGEFRLTVAGSGALAPAKTITIPAGAFREVAWLWQDGLNLWRRAPRANVWPGGRSRGHPVPDCRVCDDSYDRGERGVSYRSEPFAFRLADRGAAPSALGARSYPDDLDDLNRTLFPTDFFAAAAATPVVDAAPLEEIAIRISDPEGRARQHAFVTTTNAYEDLFPGFGSGHSALLGPGKAVTAWGCAPSTPGTYLWRDGPQPLFAAGMWGHIKVTEAAPGATGGSRCGSP